MSVAWTAARRTGAARTAGMPGAARGARRTRPGPPGSVSASSCA
ncbi:hypothetical protein BURPS1106A_1854 [Burkholderia pseudomallei 1106a]|uniref:Uncharacterized protein n=1 Tax=Burkholderia pseudomallei (strain 1106a) TaxID=357348 RepID=A3NUU7_BURP0|nr:hypothetical protein BURPS1106A_1854 [Burkholderia pseudomallei 1106a]